ncbi:MAG TPA: hypothetical protein VMY34_10750 [Acidimicrobiales bacterium]|nr:hypothetical protein [Acidimicrobiales bacterium]
MTASTLVADYALHWSWTGEPSTFVPTPVGVLIAGGLLIIGTLGVIRCTRLAFLAGDSPVRAATAAGGLAAAGVVIPYANHAPWLSHRMDWIGVATVVVGLVVGRQVGAREVEREASSALGVVRGFIAEAFDTSNEVARTEDGEVVSAYRRWARAKKAPSLEPEVIRQAMRDLGFTHTGGHDHDGLWIGLSTR